MASTLLKIMFRSNETKQSEIGVKLNEIEDIVTTTNIATNTIKMTTITTITYTNTTTNTTITKIKTSNKKTTTPTAFITIKGLFEFFSLSKFQASNPKIQ